MKLRKPGVLAALGSIMLALAVRAAMSSSTVAPTASLVLGQTDFTHNTPNFVDTTGFGNASAVAIDKSVTPNRVYVLDSANNRLLGWSNAATLSNGSPADPYSGSLTSHRPVATWQTASQSRRCRRQPPVLCA